MIWRRLKKSTKEDDENFAKMMDDEKVSFKERMLMVLTAYGVIMVPTVLILLAFGFVILLVVGIL